MGRRSQERMTGRTYEEWVKVARTHRFRRRIRRLLRLNKPDPIHYANVRRDGVVRVNPRLVEKHPPDASNEKPIYLFGARR